MILELSSEGALGLATAIKDGSEELKTNGQRLNASLASGIETKRRRGRERYESWRLGDQGTTWRNEVARRAAYKRGVLLGNIEEVGCKT